MAAPPSSSSYAALSAASDSGSDSVAQQPTSSTEPDDQDQQPRPPVEREDLSSRPSAAAVAAAAIDDSHPKPDGPAPAARLYRHALESIFAFLNLREAAAALRVSRDWLAAVQSMASLQLAVEQPTTPLFVMAGSLLARHVARVGSDWHRLVVTADSLVILARHMPQLRELYCRMELPPATVPLIFSSRLHTLRLDVIEPGAANADVNGALQAVSRLPLLESLTVRLPVFSQGVSLAPLASMPRLRELHIDTSWSQNGTELSEAQEDALRAMPHLVHVGLNPMPTSTLRRLLAQPHDLQWQCIDMLPKLDDAITALLPQLPSLTQLYVFPSCTHFDWLRGLPNLAVVHIEVDWNIPTPPAILDSLSAALQHCSQITRVYFNAPFTADHLTGLLPHLPRLQFLSFDSRVITSLSFLCQPGVARSLRSLRLFNCRQLSLSELQHAHALRGLQDLGLWHCFTTPMDTHSQSLYTPPSAVLPRLRRFSYLAP